MSSDRDGLAMRILGWLIPNVLPWVLLGLLAFLVFVVVMIGVSAHQEHEQEPQRYEVWVKHTGNPGKLTFEEWKLLGQEHKREAAPVIMPMPMPMVIR